MDILLSTLRCFVDRQPDIRRWVVAFSGGLDSSVLLQGLVRLPSKQFVQVVHIHHGLSPSADGWQQHCERVCAQLGVPLKVVRVEVKNEGEGLEAAARQARYRVFEQFLLDGDGLLLGHHLDDQAETLLLRLMRGSGPRGLAAMEGERALAAGRLFRPLLDLSRQELQQQAVLWGLTWIDDDSNESLEFDRNYLRHEVMPLLERRWSGFAQRWQRSAGLCRQSDESDVELAAADLARAEPRVERWGWSLSLQSLQLLSNFRRGNVLRCWLERLRLAPLSYAQMAQVENQLVAGRADSAAEVCWSNNRLRRYRQRLYVLSGDLESPPEIMIWGGLQPLRWGRWRLALELVEGEGVAIPAQGFEVTVRRAGDRCQPLRRNHSQTLKKLLQESALEPWLREQVPLLRVGGEIAAVGDLWLSRGWETLDKPAYRVCWQLI